MTKRALVIAAATRAGAAFEKIGGAADAACTKRLRGKAPAAHCGISRTSMATQAKAAKEPFQAEPQCSDGIGNMGLGPQPNYEVRAATLRGGFDELGVVNAHDTASRSMAAIAAISES